MSFRPTNEISFVLAGIIARPDLFEEVPNPFQNGRVPYEIAPDGVIRTVDLRYWRGEVLEHDGEHFVVEPLPESFYTAA